MQITAEGKLGLCLGLVALAGGGAMMVAPDKLWIGWTLIGLAGIGGVGLGFHHFGRKFAAIFLAVGVLWFAYWYYSNVLNAPTVTRIELPIVAPPTPAPLPMPPRPRLASTYKKMILVCDAPRSGKTLSKKEKQAEWNKYADLMEKIFGYSVKSTVGDDEVTLAIAPKQEVTSAIPITRQTYFIKRVGDFSLRSQMRSITFSASFSLSLPLTRKTLRQSRS
jgi:hypothetical protein